MYNMNRSTYSAEPRPIERAETLPYLRRVYTLFSGGIGFAIAGALVALYAGTPVLLRGLGVAIPPFVAFQLEHPWLSIIAYFAAFFGASALRQKRGINVAALFGYTFITGLFVAPALFYAQIRASAGATLDPSPIRDAFLLTGIAFGGLTTYVLTTRKDFSFLGASLNIGFWVLLGAMILGFFFHSEAFGLAIASVGVLLFSGYILYDTSRILHDRTENDAVGAALRLFLDVVNLFLFLLRILSSSRSR